MRANPAPTTESTTDGVLVVLEPANPEGTVRAAIANSDPETTTFHLLLVIPTRVYEDRRRAFADAGVPGTYTIGQAKERARQTAHRVGREFLGTETDFEATGTVGRQRDAITALAEECHFTRICVPHRNRSFLERLLGGDSRLTAIARAVSEEVPVQSIDVTSGTVTGVASDVPPDSGDSTAQSR